LLEKIRERWVGDRQTDHGMQHCNVVKAGKREGELVEQRKSKKTWPHVGSGLGQKGKYGVQQDWGHGIYSYIVWSPTTSPTSWD